MENSNKIKLIKPNYKKSILTIPNTILEYCGIQNEHPKNKLLARQFARGYKNIVLLIIDSLGVETLTQQLPKTSCLRKKMKARLLSTFPSTTACALTTLHTGLYPGEHGWLGTNMYVEPLDQVISVYKNKDTYTGKIIKDDRYYASYMPYQTIYNRIDELAQSKITIHTVFPPFVEEVSDNNYYYSTTEEMYSVISKKCKQTGKKVIVAYEDKVSQAIHKFGASTQEVNSLILEHERQIELLQEKCPDSLIIITADHGQLDNNGKTYRIDEHPDLCNLFVRQPAIEPRAISFEIKNGSEKDFKRLFNKYYKQDFALYTAKKLLAKKPFGANTSNYINLLVGNFMAISKNESRLVYKSTPGTEPDKHMASQSGLSRQEMLVPLILISTKTKKKKPANLKKKATNKSKTQSNDKKK